MNARDVTSGTGTSVEGVEPATGALSPVSVAFPDVRLLTDEDDGSQHVLVRSSDLDYPWVSIQIGDPENRDGWFDVAAARAERLIPVGPLLELLVDLDNLATAAASYSEEGAVWVRSSADRLRAVLAVLGDPPDSPARQEGDDD